MKAQSNMTYTDEQKQIACNYIYITELQKWKNTELNYYAFFNDVAEQCNKAGVELDYFLKYIDNYIRYMKEKDSIIFIVRDIYNRKKAEFGIDFSKYHARIVKAQQILKKNNI